MRIIITASSRCGRDDRDCPRCTCGDQRVTEQSLRTLRSDAQEEAQHGHLREANGDEA